MTAIDREPVLHQRYTAISQTIPQLSHIIVGVHPLNEIPFAKISNQTLIHSPKFFLKQFHRKLFPELSQNIFPAFATNTRFAIFQKYRIADFARIPASNPNIMQPTLNPSPYQQAPSSLIHTASALSGSKPEGLPGCDRRVFAFCRQALPAHCTCFFSILICLSHARAE